jgi:hypothetical protein
MINNNSLIYKIVNYFKKIKGIIIFLFIVIILFVWSNSFNLNININSNDFNLNYLYIFIMIICLILCFKQLIKKHIIIDQDQIKIIDKLFGIKIKSKYYLNVKINKFIIGLIADKNNNCVYNIYIDQNNNIQKVQTLETYKECMKIIEQIKEKCNIKIFDGTNRIYSTEEDLYREYYKLKNMINEIKNE